ncbi:hypothetical protein [Streptomyces tanashiensis]|uniref:hypothetical protein n=1 Tax=Streptomyces tanashiensis TaxID=67367 RepID=UPI00167F07B5|nr:hypothetical protein [Streptomyces tanashiensis]GGY53170.1 hypothetical protein GCM10010299_69180 [Streptomyces tanashiensis]
MGRRQLPPLPTYRKDAVTRKLCAHVHLDERFARDVDTELTADRMTALGLPLGIHLIALARHARAAVRRSERRDRLLVRLHLAFWAAVVLFLWGLVDGNSVVPWAAAAVALGSLAGAWWTVHAALSGSWRAAQDVYWGNERPERLADPVEQSAEGRLKALAKANVVPYTAAVARTDPFVGSGTKIKDVVWQPIDVSRPADDPARPGRKLTIVPFDAVDLHTYVAKEMARIAGLEGLRARNRLYVCGDHVQLLPDEFLEQPEGRPRAQIDTDLVRTALVNPGAGMRTFLSLERVSDGGRVIVTMQLRARLHHPSLSWEVLVFVIPPLDAVYSRVDSLPLRGFERTWKLLGATWGSWLSQLGGARGRNSLRRGLAKTRARQLRHQRREIAERQILFDHGATGSIRDSVSSWDQMLHNDRSDSRDYLHRLQSGVLTATEQFLKDHHVDTSSYDQAVQVISTQTYNISGDIHGSNVGNNGVVNQHGPGGHQGASPQPGHATP